MTVWHEMESDDTYAMYRHGWTLDDSSLLDAIKRTGWFATAAECRRAFDGSSWSFVVLTENQGADGPQLVTVTELSDPGSFPATVVELTPTD